MAGHLTPRRSLLIEAIKELKQQNDALRADHEALRAKLTPAAAKE